MTVVVVARQSVMDISLAQAKWVGWAGDHPRISHRGSFGLGGIWDAVRVGQIWDVREGSCTLFLFCDGHLLSGFWGSVGGCGRFPTRGTCIMDGNYCFVV